MLSKISRKQYILLVVSFLAILAESGYLALNFFRNYELEKALLKTEVEDAQNALALQSQTINNLIKELENIRKESVSNTEGIRRNLAEEARKREEAARKLEEKITQAETRTLTAQQQLQAREESTNRKISALEEKVSKNTSYDLASIISQWQPIISIVRCDFRYSDTGRLYYQTSGSGIAIKFDDAPISILTNKHVVTDDNSFGATSCSASFSDKSAVTVSSGDIRVSSKGYDLGYVYINNPDSRLRSITSQFPSFCPAKPALGDEIVVLGYPVTGSKDGATATEGIISGFDGKYFITSAKVEQGNSGGAAILLKDNCLLGIPTFVQLGKAESLARILDIWTTIEK
ncbi:MAG: trypsin-like peptidase domain-containing protein [Candidatus Pacebacteria bacterium]|nr:trypsin-like peptidase domain-containing protein [Candidatus Paceibacterota bacterium]